jgi:peroxiredoxin Q/BCP
LNKLSAEQAGNKYKQMKTLKVGDRVPEFSAHDENGNIIKLSDYSGKKLIVFFYPKANTPGCTAEACNLRDNYKELKAQGYELLGVSADSQKKQLNFKNKYQFPFPLLADEDHTILNIFGVWGPKQFMGKKYDGIHRMTFVIGGDGVVEKVIEKVKTKDHAAQLL